MTDSAQKAAARILVAELVKKFRHNEADHLSPSYNETQVRTEFITPLLGAFGWDVYNAIANPLGLREVIEEATVEVGAEKLTKRPDYELRLARQRKIFVEAKKPSVRIDLSKDAAFQTRRYGYSASLPIAVLTNFHQIIIYDCVPQPAKTDDAHVARLAIISYEEFEAKFDELWPLLSREAIYSGDFDKHFEINVANRGERQFDDLFLDQVRSWRKRLAEDMHANSPNLKPEDLTYAVQLFLSRIVFLRICEDRDIEKIDNLLALATGRSFDALLKELRRADAFYNSGLFRLLDDEKLGIRISDDVLSGIIKELYYPQSPYTFSVVETEVLGEIYEQFLGEVIKFTTDGLEIEFKPEVRESGGVVPTPRYIVDSIVQKTMGPALAGKSPKDLIGFTVADICCGSGVFLLSVFEILMDYYLSWYQTHDAHEHVGRTIYEVAKGEWRLMFGEKRRILLEHVRATDIDGNAVEVARFSLLLKLIENESGVGLRDFVSRTKGRALPTLDQTIKSGNSLVSQAEWIAAHGAFPPILLEKVNPFTWRDEFHVEDAAGGFDVIVGNPPYIRIQNMMTYSPEEAAFYKSLASPYSTAREDNFDKYALFIERSLSLIKTAGRLGVIVPHKFMTTTSGRALRRLVVHGQILEEIVHFGVQQVFGRQVANYTCLLVMDRRGTNDVTVERVGALEAWRYGAAGQLTMMPSAELSEDSWQFADADTRALFARVRAACRELGQVADLSVGVQTSADDIFIFKSSAETEDTLSIRWNGIDYPIERGILRPCILDVPVFSFKRAVPDTWMIFPYQQVLKNGKMHAQIYEHDEMVAHFPLCMEYLEARRTSLESRKFNESKKSNSQPFYRFGRAQSLTKFEGPKVIVRTLSLEARYTYDDELTMFTGGGNGPYNMVRALDGESNFFLLAILNHPLSEAMVRTNTSTFRGGYYSHGKQFIKHLPIPEADTDQRAEIERLVGEAIAANESARTALTPHKSTVYERHARILQNQVEALVSVLFGLSVSDMDLVRAVPVPV